MAWWAEDVPTLRDALRDLATERVAQAHAFVPKERSAQLLVMSSSGWSYSGPDAALTVLEDFVAADTKHSSKLGKTGASDRLIWAWTDMATPGFLRQAFSHRETRLPSRAPNLPEAITELWCIDDVYERGWRWSGAWSWVIL